MGMAEPMGDAMRQSRVTRAKDHRPWPIPTRPWLMGQTWRSLLFAHWAAPVESLRAVVPGQLHLDTWEGRGWVGVTPFAVSGLHLHGTPPMPGVAAFPELNVRTYVTVGGKPGIYFLSLDAHSRLAVAAARRAYRLPYFQAAMSIEQRDGWTLYRSRRVQADGEAASFDGRYRPTGSCFRALVGSFDYWLTERYCLYTLDPEQRVLRAEIHHPPWPLRSAEASFEQNTMAAPFGLDLQGPPITHFAARQDVVIWSPGRVR